MKNEVLVVFSAMLLLNGCSVYQKKDVLGFLSLPKQSNAKSKQKKVIRLSKISNEQYDAAIKKGIAELNKPYRQNKASMPKIKKNDVKQQIPLTSKMLPKPIKVELKFPSSEENRIDTIEAYHKKNGLKNPELISEYIIAKKFQGHKENKTESINAYYRINGKRQKL